MKAPDELDLGPLSSKRLSGSVREALAIAQRIADQEELPSLIGSGLMLVALCELGAQTPPYERYAPAVLRELVGEGLGRCLPRFFEHEREKQYEARGPRGLSSALIAAFAFAESLPSHDGILAARHLVVALLTYRGSRADDPGSWRLLALAGANRQSVLARFVQSLAAHGPSAEREGWLRLLHEVDAPQAPPDAGQAAPRRDPSDAKAPRQLRTPPSWQMLSDAALESVADDRLGYSAYAEGLADVISHESLDTPFTLAINAPWGAGKTSLANLLEKKLQARRAFEPPHVICRFNAWMHDDAPKLGTAFAAAVARDADRARSWYRRALRPLPVGFTVSSTERVRFYLLRLFPLLVFAVFAICALAGLVDGRALNAVAAQFNPSFGKWTEASASLATKVGAYAAATVVVVKVAGILMPAASAMSRFIRSPEVVAAEGGLAEIAAQLGKLIHQATRGQRRFVIFIDDLERCQPPRAVEVLEVVNQLVAHRDVVTVVLADMPAVTACAELKYKDLAERYAPNDGLAHDQPAGAFASTYGRLYVQKIIQLQFDLPPLDRGRLKALALSLADAAPTKKAPRPWWRNVQRKVASLLSPDTGGDATPYDDLVSVFSLAVPMLIAFTFQRRGHAYNVIVLLLAVLVGLVISRCYRGANKLLQRLRHQRRVARVDQRIRAELDRGVRLSPENIQARLEPQSDARERQLVAERARQLVVDESVVRHQVEAVLADYIAPLPRYAKRAINRARFAIGVAFARKLLEGDALTVADRIGKWVCLLERWPMVAQALSRQPRAIIEIEECAVHQDVPKLTELLRNIAPAHVLDSDLHGLLRRQPLFGNDLESLIRFEAAIATEGPPELQASGIVPKVSIEGQPAHQIG